MTWLRRLRPALIVLGAALVIGTLVGARALTAGPDDKPPVGPKTANPAGAGAGKSSSGPLVLGTVDSDPQPVWYGLPPVLQTGTVIEVYVKDGQEIEEGDRLYVFDTTIQQRDLDLATAAVDVAQTKVAEAKEGAAQHNKKVDVQKKVVSAAKRKEDWHTRYYKLVENNLKSGYKAQNYAEDTWPQRLADDDRLYKANVEYAVAKTEVELEDAKLATMEAANPEVLVKQAEAGVKQAEAAVRKAQAVIDLCTVKARTAGTIEKLEISPGTTIGISTRNPALWLVPAGARIVRAEVEADFAHRVGRDVEGREVTVFDNTDPKITYKGKIRRVGGTFLPKRSANEGLLGNDTRVLEAVVEVADPSPADRPPLRVGQRVRVNLGQ